MRACIALASLSIVLGTTSFVSAQAPTPRKLGPIGALMDVLLKPPPSVIYGVETPASRMARYYQLGGGVGPMPGESNGPSGGFLIPGGSDTGYSVPFLPGAGPDPALSPARRQRVIAKYERWRNR